MGAHSHHLGGGVGAQEDSVFRYKAGFSDRRHTFYTWRWVLRPEVYSDLCRTRAQWNAMNGFAPASVEYFPAYRCPTIPVAVEGLSGRRQHLSAADAEPELATSLACGE